LSHLLKVRIDFLISAMKIAIEHMGHTTQAVDEGVVDVCDALDLVESALRGAGYDQTRIEGAIVLRARQITGDQY
jgi:hypothetical protein